MVIESASGRGYVTSGELAGAEVEFTDIGRGRVLVRELIGGRVLDPQSRSAVISSSEIEVTQLNRQRTTSEFIKESQAREVPSRLAEQAQEELPRPKELFTPRPKEEQLITPRPPIQTMLPPSERARAEEIRREQFTPAFTPVTARKEFPETQTGFIEKRTGEGFVPIGSGAEGGLIVQSIAQQRELEAQTERQFGTLRATETTEERLKEFPLTFPFAKERFQFAEKISVPQEARARQPLEPRGFERGILFTGGVIGGALRAPEKFTQFLIVTPPLLFKQPKETISELGRGFGEQLRTPTGLGEIVGETAILTGIIKGAGIGIRKVPVTKTSITLPTKTGDVKITTVGFDVGTRGFPLVTKTPEGIGLGAGRITRKIKPEELAFEVEQPLTASGGRVFREALELTPEETQRIGSVVDIGRVLGTERGLKVSKFPDLTKIEGVKRPRRTSKEIERFISEEEGVVFGSLTTEQLPTQFRPTVIGDIDVGIPKRTAEELVPNIERLSGKLKALGEDVEVSPRNPLIIQFTKTGSKLLEVKPGKPSPLLERLIETGVESRPAQAGFLGFRFGNIRAGVFGATVPFGKAKAITGGEQLLRKGAGVTFARPKALQAPKEFQEAGIFPTAKRTKDLPSFVSQTEGLVAIRRRPSILRPIREIRTRQAERALETFVGTFRPIQQRAITRMIRERTVGEVPFRFEPSRTTRQVIRTVRRQSPLSISTRQLSANIYPSTALSKSISTTSRSISPRLSRSVSPSRSVSRSPSLSVSMSPISSPSVSPRPSKQPSPSVFPSGSISPSLSVSRSLSPSLSPPSPPSPSPSLFPSSSLVSPPPSIFGYIEPKPTRKKRPTERIPISQPRIYSSTILGRVLGGTRRGTQFTAGEIRFPFAVRTIRRRRKR